MINKPKILKKVKNLLRLVEEIEPRKLRLSLDEQLVSIHNEVLHFNEDDEEIGD